MSGQEVNAHLAGRARCVIADPACALLPVAVRRMSAQIGHSGGIETVVLALERLIISAATRAPVEWSNDADWPANLATEMPVAC